MKFSHPTSVVINGGTGTVNSVTGLNTDNTDPTNPVVQISVDGITIVGEGTDASPITAITNQGGKYIISGGAAWSGTGFIYDVSALTFFFNGYGTSAATSVTLDPSDPTDNRFDAIVVDELGVVSVITGTASSSPVTPAIPDDQLLVQYVLVEAGTTAPVLVQDAIYLDNAEWATSTVNVGIGGTGTVDFNATNTPKQGTKCIDATTNARRGARFVRASAITLQTYSYLQMWVRLPSTVSASKNLTVRFENSIGTPVGNTVNLFSYGVVRTITSTWQLAYVPVSAFGAITTVKGLRVIMTGGTLGQQASWDLDYILLSDGLVPQANVPTVTVQKDGVSVGARSKINFETAPGEVLTITDDSVNDRVNVKILAPIYKNAYASYISDNATPLTTVDNALIVGDHAGDSSDSANGSMLVGPYAGATAINAAYSIMVGTHAGDTAADATRSVFFGYYTAYQATGAYNSNFFGYQAGYTSTDAHDSNFFGYEAGYNAPNAYNATFIGNSAGYEASDAGYSQFIGDHAGWKADTTQKANFIGYRTGYNDTFGALFDASRANFFGYEAGFDAGNANDSQFFGFQSGYGATNASFSNFFGTGSGNGATDASISNFIGYRAGYGATNATNATFIGYQSGDSDTVDNTGGGFSVLIGPNTSTGGFSNSIAIGDAAVNTATNQLMIGSSGTPITKMHLELASYANDAAAGLAGLVAGDWYYNTTTPAVDIKQ